MKWAMSSFRVLFLPNHNEFSPTSAMVFPMALLCTKTNNTIAVIHVILKNFSPFTTGSAALNNNDPGTTTLLNVKTTPFGFPYTATVIPRIITLKRIYLLVDRIYQIIY